MATERPEEVVEAIAALLSIRYKHRIVITPELKEDLVTIIESWLPIYLLNRLEALPPFRKYEFDTEADAAMFMQAIRDFRSMAEEAGLLPKPKQVL